MTQISDIVIKFGGYIFGGFVRDKCIHDHYAEMFYNKYNGKDAEKSSTDIDIDKRKLGEKYSDPTFDVETKYRLLIPNDIDVFIEGTIDDVEKFYIELQKAGFFVIRKKKTTKYFTTKKVNQQKIFVKSQLDIGLKLDIEMDVLYALPLKPETILPPFGNLDLLCNSLIMDSKGIHFYTENFGTTEEVDYSEMNPYQKKMKEFEIFQNNLLLKSEIIYYDNTNDPMTEQKKQGRKIRFNRILNMQIRGWTLTNNKVYSVVKIEKQIQDNNNKSCKDESKIDTDQCLICKEEFTDDTHQIILKCCSQKLHVTCFTNYVESEYDERLTPRCMNACSSRDGGWQL